MENEITRRNFLSQSTVMAGSGAVASVAAAAAANKTSPAAMGDVKPSLYSITYLGYWYRGEALTMTQLIERAKRYNYEGIEIEGKRPHGMPLDWPKKRCVEFKKQVADAGLVITGVAADNDFSNSISEHREAQIVLLREHMRMTSDLGAKVLRVFLAWAGANKLPDGGGRYDLAQKIWQLEADNYTEDQRWAWCRESLIESAKYAGEFGVTLALQNHKPMITNYQQVLRMVKEVNSPNLKVALDAPLMEKRDPAYLKKAVHDIGALQVQTHFGGDFERKTPGAPIQQIAVKGQWMAPYIYGGYINDNIYVPFIEALLETGYRGYMGYELCHPLPVVNGKTVGIDYVDRNVQLANEFIRSAISEARKNVAARRG